MRKGLFTLTAEEKRQYRIQRLVLAQQEAFVSKQLKEIKSLTRNLLEDTMDTVEPYIELMRPMIEQAQRDLDKKVHTLYTIHTRHTMHTIHTRH